MIETYAHIPDFVDWSNPVNADAPLNRGLVAWWKVVPGFQGWGSGKLHDMLGRNHGTLTNGPTWSGPRGRPGGWGSMGFGGTGVAATTLAIIGGPISIGFWVEVLSANVGGRTAFSKSNNPNPPAEDRCLAHVPFSDSTLYWDYGNATGGSGRLSTSFASYLNKWTRVLLVSAGSGGSHQAIYLDGRLIASQSASASPSAGSAFMLGGTDTGGTDTQHKGMLDDFKVWNRVLSAADAAHDYQASLASYPNELNWLRRRRYAPEQGGGGGFQAAWAYRSNVVLQAGVPA